MELYKKKYSLILNLITKLRLFLRQDKDLNWVLYQFDLGWKMIFLLGAFTFLGIILGELTIQELFRDFKWGAVLFLAMFLSRKMGSATKELFSIKLALMLPEDLQAILKDMQERWIKKQNSPQKIRYLTFRYLFDMVLGYVKSQIENIWLPKSDSTKEIE